MRRSCVVVALLTAVASSQVLDACDQSYLLTSSQSPSDILSVSQINSILTEVNNARRSVSPYAERMPMLQWDQNLANYAQEYIDTCPGLGYSSPNARQNLTRFQWWYVGENLAGGTHLGDADGGVKAMQMWNRASSSYSLPTCSTGQCWHYTQNIWAETTHIGCGYASCPLLPFKHYWVCNYGGGGNIVGEQPYVAAADLASSALCTRDRGEVASLPTTTVPPVYVPDACDNSYLLSQAPAGSVLSVDQINTFLRVHNDARRSVKPYAHKMPMLQWSQTLANFAQSYLDTCPGLVHSTADARMDDEVTGYWYVGENMAGGVWLGGPNGALNAAKLWAAEGNDWTFPQTCRAGKSCWHYTQAVWAKTTEIGCGYVQCNDNLQNYWSCIYGLGGNFVGDHPYTVATSLETSDVCTRDRGSIAVLPPTTPRPTHALDACDDTYYLTSVPAGSTLTLNQINNILREHNHARRDVQPMAKSMPMLKWDQRLADFAHEYINTCPGLTHSTAEVRQNMQRFGFWYVGENLAGGVDMVGDDGGAKAVRQWLDEQEDWTFPLTCNPDTECLHYTQCVWAQSTHIGCSMAVCPNNPYRYYWSCIYGLGGNFIGSNPYEPTNNIQDSDQCTRARGVISSL